MSKQFLFAIIKDAEFQTLVAFVEKSAWEKDKNLGNPIEFSDVPDGFYEISDNVYETDLTEEEDIQEYLVNIGFIESKELKEFLLSEI